MGWSAWLAEVTHEMILLLLKCEHVAFCVFVIFFNLHVLGICIPKAELR